MKFYVACFLLLCFFACDDEKEVEDELVQALKEKYDALKDKIYEEALKA